MTAPKDLSIVHAGSLYKLQSVAPNLQMSGETEVTKTVLLSTLQEALPPEYLQEDEIKVEILVFEQRFDSAAHFYNADLDLEGDKQVMLAFSTFCRLMGMDMLRQEFEGMHQFCHSQLHAEQVA